MAQKSTLPLHHVVQIDLKRETYDTSATIKAALPDNDKEWLVWSYCGIAKNGDVKSLPLVLVAFRECRDGWASDNLRYANVAIPFLGKLRIGTIWKAQKQVGKLVLEEKIFSISYDINDWKHASFHDSTDQAGESPYPFELYPLKQRDDRNQHLIVRLGRDNRLVIPCLEYFSRMYGRSQEIPRVLATYQWSEFEGDDANHLLAAPPPMPHGKQGWVVKLRPKLKDSDAVFLAHMKYDVHTRNVAKEIYLQLETQFGGPGGTQRSFIKIKPWFTGKTKIKVQGLWFDKKKSFLALRIVGHEDPKGPVIYIDHDSQSNSDEEAKDDEVSTLGASMQRRISAEEDLRLTGADEPSHGAGSVEVLEDEFEELGTPRYKVSVYREQGQGVSVSTAEPRSKDIDMASPGEQRHPRNDVARADIHAKPFLESSGTLLDMWRAARYVSANEPELISSVQSFTLQEGYSSNVEPLCIPFTTSVGGSTSNDRSKMTVSACNWQYLRRPGKVRGLLVMRLQCRDKSIHIVEIQRRQKVNSCGVREEAEGYRGIVMILANDDLLYNWLLTFLTDASVKLGVIASLLDTIPGDSYVFKHPKSISETVPSEASLLNALSKVGIKRMVV